MTELQAEYKVQLSEPPEPDTWRCENCGAVLGRIIRHHYTNSEGERRRQTRMGLNVDCSEVSNVAGVTVSGWCRVLCSCGEVREWYPGDEFIERLERRNG